MSLLIAGYFVAYIDRVNIGVASLTTNRDLGFSPKVFAFGAGIFSLGYYLFEVPSNLLLHRFGARHWIAHVVHTWGLFAGALAFVQGETGSTSFASYSASPKPAFAQAPPIRSMVAQSPRSIPVGVGWFRSHEPTRSNVADAPRPIRPASTGGASSSRAINRRHIKPVSWP